jgi:hypothetical protein
MGSLVIVPLADVGSQTNNVATDLSALNPASMWIVGTFAGTIQVQVSADGTTFVSQGSPVTAPAQVALPADTKFARINVTAYSSGTVKSLVVGRYAS